MKRLLNSLILALLATGAMAQVNTYSVGQTVNDFTVIDSHGNEHNLYSITASGKYVMLDFFFVTCPPCQATQPYFNQLHETYGCNGHDLFVLSINQGYDNDAQVNSYENTYGGNYAHGPAASMQGGSQAVAQAFGINAYPTYCLIGPDNKLVNGDIWPVSSMQSYINAFPSGSNIQPAECAAIAGISELEAPVVMHLFPVPSSGTITVELALATTGMVDLEVMDALGRAVHAENLGRRGTGAFTTTADLGHLADGNYAVRINLDGVPALTRHLVIAR